MCSIFQVWQGARQTVYSYFRSHWIIAGAQMFSTDANLLANIVMTVLSKYASTGEPAQVVHKSLQDHLHMAQRDF